MRIIFHSISVIPVIILRSQSNVTGSQHKKQATLIGMPVFLYVSDIVEPALRINMLLLLPIHGFERCSQLIFWL